MKSPFESKKEFTVPWIIVMMLFLLTMLAGCDDYQEGDIQAQHAFDQMTIVEKGMYDAVEKVWGEKYLVNVRQAVAGRESKPLENNIPFIDIANVIKSNNDITLKIDEQWRTDTKNSAISGRWDRLDGKWYVKIINKLGMKETDIQRQEFVVEEVIPDKPNVEITVTNASDSDYNPADETVEEKEYFDTVNDIILLQEYDDLYYSLRGCQPAIDKYSSMIEEKLITKGDREWLLQIAIKCKAHQIKAKLTNGKSNKNK